LVFHYSRTKDSYTVSRLAKLQSVSPSTIRKRLERGWTDDEIIEGRRSSAPVNVEYHPRLPAPRDYNHQSLRLERPKHAREIQWQENASYAAWCRKEHGEEHCIVDFDTLEEDGRPYGILLKREIYEKRFLKWWEEWKPHLIRAKLPEWAQDIIARGEGTTLTEIRRGQAELRDLL
jgi:hypothetical protein